MHGWTCQRCLVPIVANLSSILRNILVLVLYGRAKLELTFISVFTWVAIIIVLPGLLSVVPRPTQPPTLSGMGNEYQPKCGDALRLGSKGKYGSFHLWINVWVAGKTV